MMKLRLFHVNNENEIKNNPLPKSFPSSFIAKRRGGVVYAAEVDEYDDNKKDNRHHHHGKLQQSYSHRHDDVEANHGIKDNHNDVHLIHPRHPEIRTKSSLKVKTLEDSLRSCDQQKRLMRQSSSYGRMMTKLQAIRTKSKNRRALSSSSSKLEATNISLNEKTKIPDAVLPQQQTVFDPFGSKLSASTEETDKSSELSYTKETAPTHVEYDKNDDESIGRKVSFSTIQIRNYQITVIVNPSVLSGPAIGLSWIYDELPSINVDQYEQEKQRGGSDSSDESQHRPLEELRLSLADRQRLMKQMGLSTRQAKAYLKRLEASRKHQRRRATALEESRKITVVGLGQPRQHRSDAHEHDESTPSTTFQETVAAMRRRDLSLVWRHLWQLLVCKTDETLQDELWDRAQDSNSC